MKYFPYIFIKVESILNGNLGIYEKKKIHKFSIIYSTPYRSRYTTHSLFRFHRTPSRSREITNLSPFIKYSKSSFQFRNNAFPIKLPTNSTRIYIYIYTRLQYTIVDSNTQASSHKINNNQPAHG